MKLLHVTDFHADRRWFPWLVANAEKYDLVLYTGDFIDLFGQEPLGSQVSWITTGLGALRQRLLFCSGNHDVETMKPPVASGRWMTKLPGAHRFGESGCLQHRDQSFARVNWRGPVPQLRADDLILAHAPPAGCFTSTSADGLDYGNSELTDVLRTTKARPMAVLSGHVHRPKRWHDRCGRTITLNPGMADDTAIPNFIIIDTDRRVAQLFKNVELVDSIALPAYAKSN